MGKLFFFINLINSIQIKEIYSLELLTHLLKLSAVRKVLETIVFLALGSFGTLGPNLSHGTSKKFADVRPHLRKVFKITLSLSSIHQTVDFLFGS